MGQQKLHVGILFGGNSPEHEISLFSAKNIIKSINKEKYTIVLIGITRSGRWILVDEEKFSLDPLKNTELLDNPYHCSVTLLAGDTEHRLLNINTSTVITHLDVIFPVLHGPYGEDGDVQGFLSLVGIPCVGSHVLSSAICMDKDIMKHVLHSAGIAITPWLTLHRRDYAQFDAQQVEKQLGYPCFVKPANTGSSIGVHKVKTAADLKAALDNAFLYDHKIIIEAFVAGREIECAVLGNDDPKVAVPGEVITSHEFYDYNAKYFDAQLRLDIPAQLPATATAEVQMLARKAFLLLGCSGFARVDFFLKATGEFVLNELNTIPGFTGSSLYPKAWEVSGLSQTALLDELIQLAFERFESHAQLKSDYQA